VNTPLGIIRSTAGTFSKTQIDLFNTFPNIINKLTLEQQPLLLRLLQESIDVDEVIDSRERRSLKKV
jgi:hypothetical protein